MVSSSMNVHVGIVLLAFDVYILDSIHIRNRAIDCTSIMLSIMTMACLHYHDSDILMLIWSLHRRQSDLDSPFRAQCRL